MSPFSRRVLLLAGAAPLRPRRRGRSRERKLGCAILLPVLIAGACLAQVELGWFGLGDPVEVLAESSRAQAKPGLDRRKLAVPTPQASSIHRTITGKQPAFKYENKSQIYIDFAPGGSIQGGGTHGLTLKNCTGVLIQGPEGGYGLIKGYGGRGIYVQNCRSVQIKRVHVDQCGQDQNQYGGPPGILVGQSTGVIIEHSKFSNNGTHGVYFGDSNDNIEVSDCEFWGNRACGVQVNAISADHGPGPNPWNDNWTEGMWVVRNKMWDNGELGTGGINLMGIRKNGNCYDNWIRRANNGIALSNNGVSGRGASGTHFHGNIVEALKKPALTTTSDSGTQAQPNGYRDAVWISTKSASHNKWNVDEGNNAKYANVTAAYNAGAVPKAFLDLGK